MAKMTAWLVTIIGILLVLPEIGIDLLVKYNSVLIALAVLAIGIGKLVRNYSYKKRK